MEINRTRDRLKNTVNAGSMADFAFLLLIFFLVTATIAEDQGIMVRLPPWTIENKPLDIPSRNVYKILVNGDDKLLARDEEIPIPQLKNRIKAFISNPTRKKDLASSPQKAIVSLKNDHSTSYAAYITVYNEIKSAYAELRDEMAKETHGKSYINCDINDQRKIRAAIPLVISEAEPTDYANL